MGRVTRGGRGWGVNLYEVVRWGNDSSDPIQGGPGGPDTCFLVQAATPEEAASLADCELAGLPHGRVPPAADVVYLLGVSAAAESCIIRGPYVEHAVNRGWRAWGRGPGSADWVESAPRP